MSIVEWFEILLHLFLDLLDLIVYLLDKFAM